MYVNGELLIKCDHQTAYRPSFTFLYFVKAKKSNRYVLKGESQFYPIHQFRHKSFLRQVEGYPAMLSSLISKSTQVV